MKFEALEQNHYYHIYNRGVNGEVIFKDEENMDYFLRLFRKHLGNHVEVLAYCLMKNHYHFVLKVKSEAKLSNQAFSNLFNAYAKAFNKQNARSGSLFEKHFRTIKIENESYLRNVIVYVHNNPLHHGMANDINQYKHSSYRDYLEMGNSIRVELDKEMIAKLFDDLDNFKLIHKKRGGEKVDLQGFENLVGLQIEGKSSLKSQFYKYIQTLQDTITSQLEAVDGEAKFKEDIWERAEGGGGRSRVIENGKVFEKGGVNISAVHGELPKAMQNYFQVEEADFYACGLSLVLHPKNPLVPTVHANWRYFEMYKQHGEIVDRWFGGGQDLTPYYLFEDDARHFHQVCKKVCDEHHPNFYSIYKQQCDEYFWNSHREEARGIGGLFFDHCKEKENFSIQNWFNFVTSVGNSFLESYIPIVEKRKDLEFTKDNTTWQEIRRGRYVEFNLIHDKGTLFGLKTNGRTESILMSLPPKVQWVYDHHPDCESEEEKLIQVLKNPKPWV